MRKPGPPRDVPPPLELECLKVLWSAGEGNVQQVRDALAGARPLAYTTVMTVLDRLVKRGIAARGKAGRSYVYTPLISRDEVRRLAVRDLVNTLFDGSEAALVAFLAAGPTVATPSPEPSSADHLDTALL